MQKKYNTFPLSRKTTTKRKQKKKQLETKRNFWPFLFRVVREIFWDHNSGKRDIGHRKTLLKFEDHQTVETVDRNSSWISIVIFLRRSKTFLWNNNGKNGGMGYKKTLLKFRNHQTAKEWDQNFWKFSIIYLGLFHSQREVFRKNEGYFWTHEVENRLGEKFENFLDCLNFSTTRGGGRQGEDRRWTEDGMAEGHWFFGCWRIAEERSKRERETEKWGKWKKLGFL